MQSSITIDDGRMFCMPASLHKLYEKAKERK